MTTAKAKARGVVFVGSESFDADFDPAGATLGCFLLSAFPHFPGLLAGGFVPSGFGSWLRARFNAGFRF